MSDTKTPGEKKIGSGKTLTLKPRTETGVVRQSFSHGRTKQVVVEKVKRRVIGGAGDAKPEPVAEPVVAPKRAAPPPASSAPPRGSRTVEIRRRAAHADRRRAQCARPCARRRAGARSRRAQDCRGRRPPPPDPRRHRTGRARGRRGPQARGRRAASPRGRSQAQGRAGSQEALWRRRARPQPRPPLVVRRLGVDAQAASIEAEEEEASRRQAADAVPAPAHRCARSPRQADTRRRAEAAHAPDGRQRRQRRRGARAFGRVVPPPHPAPQGPSRRRAEGKADPRSRRFRKPSPSRNSPTAWPSAASTSSAC